MQYGVLQDYVWVAIFAIVGIGFAVVTLVLAAWVSHIVRRNRIKTNTATYECGEEPIGQAWKQFRVGYYIFALMFVIFDIETVFIVPWAFNLIHLKQMGLGLFAFVEMLIFLIILVVGWLYAWRKGVLRWD
ncbi:MAG: NADH-quinone oxidoreductase subunit A [Armatimonadetes bacterium]|nr:NADH-quinone oxidoreductase subunit A [Armatimonadota bacterium]